MIAKWKSNISVSATLDYNFKDESQIIQSNNLQGDCYQDFNLQMLARQNQFRGNARNLTAHIILSPSMPDAERLTRLEWKEISGVLLQKAGLAHLQSVVFLHTKVPNHLHIVVNRIDKDGSIFRGKNELAISQRIGNEIAIELGLVQAREVRLAKQKAPLEIPVFENISDYKKSQSPVDYQTLNPTVFGVKVLSQESLDRKGEETNRGYSIQLENGGLVAASPFGEQAPSQLLKQPNNSRKDLYGEDEKSQLEKVRSEFEFHLQKIMHEKTLFNRRTYFSDLRKRGYNVIEFRKRKTGVLFGYGVQKDGFRFTASEIGLEYTLSNMGRLACRESIDAGQPRAIPNQLKQENDVLSHQNFDSQQSQSVSQELNRTICAAIIKKDLNTVAAEGPYNSFFDFVEAIRRRKYVVDLLKKEEDIIGYTIHFGAEHFQDHGFAQGQFSIEQLILKGVLQKDQNRLKIEETLIDGIKESSPGEDVHGHETTIQINQLDDPFTIKEISGQNRASLNEIKQVMTDELFEIIDSLGEKNIGFSIDRFVKIAAEEGFFFNGIADSKLRLDYTISKYGYSFRAEELHWDLNAKRLHNLEVNSSKSRNQFENRAIGYKPARDIDYGQGFGYGR